MPHTVLRLPTVKARTGLSRSTIYLRVSRGAFPAPVSLGGRAVGWIEAEVNAWLAAQIKKRRTIAPAGRGLRRRRVSGWTSVDEAASTDESSGRGRARRRTRR